MQVSTVSTNSSKAVFSTKASYRMADDTLENSLINSESLKTNNVENRNKLFDSINEWKSFCHRQIEKGNLDIIA